MTDITLIFPGQLFLNHPCIASRRQVYLVEEYLFFKVQPFHKQRLVLLKSAMQKYAEALRKKQLEVIYISSSNYILKMSNYPKGNWMEIWDGLFWRFVLKRLTGN